MVRKNEKQPGGFDHNKGVSLNSELEAAGKSFSDTSYPEGEPNKMPIAVRGDDVPTKTGKKKAKS